jgi:uncharacterized protein YkwD
MPRFRMLVLCVLVACLTVPALPTATASAGRSAEDQMVAKINAYRANRGLPRVRKSKSLTASAERYSWKQMNNGYFGHSSRIQASSKYRRLGEILAYVSGSRARVDQAFRMWLNSGGHRAVIMDRGFRYVGAGVAQGRFRGNRAAIWTVQFGAR